MAAKTIKLSKKHENQWVAVTLPDNKVVGSGREASTARASAARKGYKHTVLLKVLPFNLRYVGSHL